MTIVQKNQVSRPALILVLLIIGLVLVSGCTSSPSDQQKTTTTVTTTASSPSASAAGTTAQAIGSTSVSGASSGTGNKSVDSARMIALLPAAPAGWVMADKPTGFTMTETEGHPWTMVKGSYTSTANKDTTASITYQDTANQDVGFRSNWKNFHAVENSDGSFRSTRVKGNPAWEVFTKPDSYGGWVSVNDRFMIYVSVDKGTKADYDSIINAIDFAGIAALK
jgi:hypothetical protein